MFALTNDRAQVQAAHAARDYNQQSLDAEEKKLHLGASTTANVLQQQRNLAMAEDNLIAAHAAYAKDRAGLYQTSGFDVAALRHQSARGGDGRCDDDARGAGSGTGQARQRANNDSAGPLRSSPRHRRPNSAA